MKTKNLDISSLRIQKLYNPPSNELDIINLDLRPETCSHQQQAEQAKIRANRQFVGFSIEVLPTSGVQFHDLGFVNAQNKFCS